MCKISSNKYAYMIGLVLLASLYLLTAAQYKNKKTKIPFPMHHATYTFVLHRAVYSSRGRRIRE